MSAMSDYLEGKISDLIHQGVAFTPPETWVALFTSDPGEAGGGTEVTGGSYARVQVNRDGVTAPFWNAHVDGVNTNNGTLTWPTATAPWGDVSHFAIFDAAVGGNQLEQGAMDETKTVGTGDTYEIADGQLSVTYD